MKHVDADDRITFSLRKKDKNEFKKTLIDEGDSMSDVLRKAVKDYVNRHNLQRVYS
jgi:hypothetical protein